MDDAERTAKVTAWLRSHGIPAECRECGARGSEVIGNALAPNPLLPPGENSLYGRGMPVVEVACGACGHVRYFATKRIGVEAY